MLSVELERLPAAVVGGGSVATLSQAIRDQKRLDVLTRELADLGKLRVAPIEPALQRQMLRTKLSEWKGLLREHAPRARQMLRKPIEGGRAVEMRWMVPFATWSVVKTPTAPLSHA